MGHGAIEFRGGGVGALRGSFRRLTFSSLSSPKIYGAPFSFSPARGSFGLATDLYVRRAAASS